jgi:hypothetical protein
MNHKSDDFEELFALLSNAAERYRSVRATLVHAVNATLAKEANRRFVDWRFGGREPGMGIIGKPGPPEPGDFYHEYEDSEERIHLWHRVPALWREEIYDPEGRFKEAEVHGGKNGPRWTYEKHDLAQEVRAVYMPRIPERQETDTRFSFMFDPSEYVFSETFWDGTTVNKTGRELTVAGRGCVEVCAKTVSWGYPPSVFDAYHAFSEGATDHLLLVDAEIGPILRVAARLEGREFRVAEATEVAFDEEEFREGTFRLELPGVQFRQLDI